jgi:hypothetical protein
VSFARGPLSHNVLTVIRGFGKGIHHRVMRRETDDQVAAVPIEETLPRFPRVCRASTHKGLRQRLRRLVPISADACGKAAGVGRLCPASVTLRGIPMRIAHMLKRHTNLDRCCGRR